MKKKFLVATLSLLCMGCVAGGVACAAPQGGGDAGGDSSVVVLNGFNHWDDMVVIYLDPATFDGSMKLNTDASYIAEGKSSYKCFISSTAANQPELKMTASGRKTDITDVSNFGLYIYNTEDYEFDVIVTAYAGDKAVCAPYAKVQPGANNLVFNLNRAAVQSTGRVITEYSIAFSGVRANSTFYIDNFYAKTTTNAVVVPAAAQALIDDIKQLSESSTKAELEAIMGDYNALTADEKQAVTNYDRLETLIKPFWIQDLDTARTEDSSKLLYFDYPFASVQITGTTSGVGSYAYTTAKSYGNQNGSLKVDFTVSPTNWVNINTSAKNLIDEEFIEFYVYNDSDQYKAMCVGWNVPVNANYSTYMVLEPNAWTQVWSKSTDLTSSGGSSGAFEVCGLSDLTDRRACAPKGSLYFSSVVKIRPSEEAQAVIDEIATLSGTSSKTALEGAYTKYQALSTKDKQSVSNYSVLQELMVSKVWNADLSAAQTGDPHTLLYFDEEFGAGQVTKADKGIAAYGYSTERKYGDETGSLKVEFYERTPGFMPVAGWMSLYTTATEDITDADTIRFYVYNDSDQYKGIALGWIAPNGSPFGYQDLAPNAWTEITCKASALTTGLGEGNPTVYNYRGRIQIVAINDTANRSVRAPEGALYFSSVQKLNTDVQVQEARKGADANTLIFFDRQLGLDQATADGGIKAFDSTVLFNGQTGALKMTYTGNGSPTLGLNTCGYQGNSDDYVVLYVKADIDAQYMSVRVGTLYGTHCINGKWTQVIFPLSALDSTSYLRFEASNDGANYWNAKESANMNGRVYITKAKVIPASQVKNLAEVADTDTYNVGQTAFVGKMDYYGTKGTYMYNPTVYASFYDTNVALVGGEVRFYARSLHPNSINNGANTDGTNETVHTVIGMELAEASDKNKMYIVASGLVYEQMYVQCFTGRESGHFATAQVSNNNLSYEVLEDGYVRYCLDLSTYSSAIKYFRLFTGVKLQMTDAEVIQIRDVYFGD